MQDIDFLPNRIREKHARRRVQLARLCAVSLLAFGVAAAAIGQFAIRRAVKADLAGVSGRYTLAQIKHAEFNELSQELRQNEEVAELAVLLQHPWPRTQLMKTIVEALPPAIAISELTISSRVPQRTGVRSNQVQLNSTKKESLSAARQDLRDLHEQLERQQTVIELSGRSRDASALHAFVARLDQEPLFQEAKLDSLETRDAGDTSTFLVRIVVRTGYGRNGGPEGEVKQDLTWRFEAAWRADLEETG